ncbi:acyl carrier protein phosphodiesterase [Saprospiraceae bacterium]|nr:acyl carrier protein phosphodiesterase [Saprospiraceae bacterium]MDC1305447.1 acyl carrier protein phosphodiesterase [Saprospiraceae bacterium]
MYLSCSDEDLIIGNMLVDMMSIKRLRELPGQYHKGFELHRLIDSCTDEHPKVKEAVLKLRENHRKYAPVVIDIFYDYVLSLEWERYSEEDIQDFCNGIYEVINKHLHNLPKDIVIRLEKMLADNFLMTCSSPKAIKRVFDLIDSRAKFNNNFSLATKDLLEDYDYFRDNFFKFFPDMIEKSVSHRSLY